MTIDTRHDAGFTLIEALVATAIVVSTTAGVMALLNPARGTFSRQPEATDLQQRLRMGVDALSHALVSAGAGPDAGPGAGALLTQFAPILPFRRGRDPAIDDAAAVFKRDAITVFSVEATAVQAALRTDMASSSSAIVIDALPGCPRDDRSGSLDPLCGLGIDGTKAALFDGTGAVDTIAVTSVDEAMPSIGFFHPQQSALSKAYKGASSRHATRIVEITSHVYYLNASTKQLMHHDGVATVSPVLDNVVDLQFSYFGEAAPPRLLGSGTRQSASYGPAPPPVDVAEAPFAAGENCTWQMAGGSQVTRLAALDGGGGLIELTPAQLVDGPWCPDEGNERRYDADLFRIRKIRVTLGLRGGTGTNAQPVPDRTVRFEISPRNMNFGQ